MSTLSFAQSPVDEAVLALLQAPTNLHVHIGSVTDSDASTQTVSAPLPYLLYGSTLGAGASPRMGGVRGRLETFTTTYTHSTVTGAKSVALAVRAYLDGALVTINGRARRISLDDPQARVFIQEDPQWTRPGGLPLFFATDRWNVRA